MSNFVLFLTFFFSISTICCHILENTLYKKYDFKVAVDLEDKYGCIVITVFLIFSVLLSYTLFKINPFDGLFNITLTDIFKTEGKAALTFLEATQNVISISVCIRYLLYILYHGLSPHKDTVFMASQILIFNFCAFFCIVNPIILFIIAVFSNTFLGYLKKIKYYS